MTAKATSDVVTFILLLVEMDPSLLGEIDPSLLGEMGLSLWGEMGLSFLDKLITTSSSLSFN